jgi:hypothetical protein
LPSSKREIKALFTYSNFSFGVSCCISRQPLLFFFSPDAELTSVRDVQKENKFEILHFHIPTLAREFSFICIAHPGSLKHPACHPGNNGNLSPGLKLPVRETDYSLSFITEVKSGVIIFRLLRRSSYLGA